MSSVLVKDLTLKFGAATVLDKLNLDIAEGEFLVLLGASGCGKSTLLNCIAGLLDISEGEVHIDGKNVTWAEPSDRGIGMVFQSYALYPQMTVRGNLSFGLKNARMPKEEIDKRVRKAASILELEKHLDRKPGMLSGGQRQRVAMGRAIVRQPAAFLMDEPLSNLDAKLRVQMRAEIAALQRELAVTTVYVTHDQTEAMTMGDRVAVLKDGFLQQVDTPQNLYDRPDNVFVAAFIGSPSMNLYDAAFTLQGDGAQVQLGSQSLSIGPETLAARPGLRAHNGERLIVGIRPEDFEDASMASGGADGRRLKASVTLIEALGAELMVHFNIDARTVDSGDPDAPEDKAVAGAANAVGRFHPRSRVRIGDAIDVAVSTENMHFFDAASRTSIWS